MKPLVFLLGVSLVANAVLVGLRMTSTTSAPSSPGRSAASVGGATSSAESAATTAAEATLAGQDSAAWDRFQAGGDPGELAARLRRAGFPPHILRAILNAQISETYRARRKALLAGLPEPKYWELTGGSMLFDSKTLSALRELDRQQQNELKAALGPDAGGGHEVRDEWRRRQYGDLAPDKIEQVQAILSDYGDLRRDIQAKAGGVLLPEDREKLAMLEKEQRADLASLLTPAELAEHELRASNTANALRYQLSTFKPSETEFRALFDATRAAEEKHGSLAGTAYNSDQAKKIREDALAGMKDRLTPERYAELEQATDPKYQMTNRLVDRLGLPQSRSVDVVNIQQDILKRAGEVRSDKTLTPLERTALNAELAKEAATKLTSALTPAGYEAYRQTAGQWLRGLQPAAGKTAP